MKMTDLLEGVLGNSGGLLEHLQGDQTREGGLADLLLNLGAEQTKPDGNIFDQIGSLIKGKQADDAPDDFLDFLEHVNGPADGMDKTTGLGAAATLAMSMVMGRNPSGFAAKAVKMGGVNTLGASAMTAFQSWQNDDAAAPAATTTPPIHELSGTDADVRAQAVLMAMIAAAKADEHIDAVEEARLVRAIEQSGMDVDAQRFFVTELKKPLDAGRVAALADDLETGAEIYAATLLVIDEMDAAERLYLSDLKEKLGLPAALVASLEKDLKA